MPKVKVPASAGSEITITHGSESRSYKVDDDRLVTVNNDDLAHFLAVVDGSTEAKPASNKKD